MHGNGLPHRSFDGANSHCKRHRPQRTAFFRLALNTRTFFAQADEATCASLPLHINDEFDRDSTVPVQSTQHLAPRRCFAPGAG